MTISLNTPFNHFIYHRLTRELDESQCEQIVRFFYHALENDSPALKKTHLFHGRYENIYLKDDDFEPLQQFVKDAIKYAASLLESSADKISMDYWFNDMPPKHITDWHRHDVMDEQLSAVYYLKIPQQSGDLLIKHDDELIRIKPKVNDFVFFNPAIDHSVEENKSSQSRLSIGMNFGFKADKE